MQKTKDQALFDLATTTEPFVSVDQLAWYWNISRWLVYEYIHAGVLPALQFGPRTLRVSTDEAREFEEGSGLVVSPKVTIH